MPNIKRLQYIIIDNKRIDTTENLDAAFELTEDELKELDRLQQQSMSREYKRNKDMVRKSLGLPPLYTNTEKGE